MRKNYATMKPLAAGLMSTNCNALDTRCKLAWVVVRHGIFTLNTEQSIDIKVIIYSTGSSLPVLPKLIQSPSSQKQEATTFPIRSAPTISPVSGAPSSFFQNTSRFCTDSKSCQSCNFPFSISYDINAIRFCPLHESRDVMMKQFVLSGRY